MLTTSGSSALAWTPIVAAALVVAARISVRIKLRAVGIDDYLMLLALLFAVISAALAVTLFLDKSVTALEIGRFYAINTLASVTAYISLLLSKTSIGFFLIRLMGPTLRWHRWFVGVTMACLGILTFLVLVDVFLPLCTEENAFKSTSGCITPHVHVGFDQAWNFYGVFFDVSYSTLPVHIIHKLNMKRSKKVGVSVLLGLGWIAAIFTLLRAIAEYGLWSIDTTSLIVRLATAMEQGLVMICGSLATLAPLFEYWWTGKPLSFRTDFQSHTYVNEPRKASFLTKCSREVVSTVRLDSGSARERPIDELLSTIPVGQDVEIDPAHHGNSPV